MPRIITVPKPTFRPTSPLIVPNPRLLPVPGRFNPSRIIPDYAAGDSLPSVYRGIDAQPIGSGFTPSITSSFDASLRRGLIDNAPTGNLSTDERGWFCIPQPGFISNGAGETNFVISYNEIIKERGDELRESLEQWCPYDTGDTLRSIKGRRHRGAQLPPIPDWRQAKLGASRKTNKRYERKVGPHTEYIKYVAQRTGDPTWRFVRDVIKNTNEHHQLPNGFVAQALGKFQFIMLVINPPVVFPVPMAVPAAATRPIPIQWWYDEWGAYADDPPQAIQLYKTDFFFAYQSEGCPPLHQDVLVS